MNLYIYSESLFNTKYIVIKHNVKRFPSDKINITKTAVFLSNLFNFNLQFLYQLMHMVYLSKTVCGIFHFQFCLIFIEIYIFVQQNMFVLFDFKNVIIPFKIKVIEKIYIVLLPDLGFLSCNNNFENSVIFG